MSLYLSSYEYKDFEIPRSILRYEKTILEGRNILIVEIDKPLIGQKYGLFDNNVSQLYLMNRVNEDAFYNLNIFPIDVHVLIRKSEIIKISSLSDLQNIAWACIYDNKWDALNHKVV